MNTPPITTLCRASRAANDTTARPGVISVGTGQPVVMLHAAMSSKLQWSALADRLSNRFQAIAIDLHGYGDNPLPRRAHDYSIADELALICSRIAEAGADGRPVHLVGHSFGAQVALQFAQRHPDRVLSLTLYEPVLLGLLGRNDLGAGAVRQLGKTLMALVAEGRICEAAELAVDFWQETGTFAALPPGAKARALAGVTQAALDFDRIINQPMKLESFAALAIPTLLLGGAHSPTAARSSVTLLDAAMPLSHVVWLNADHMAPITSADLVNPFIAEFIASQPAHVHVRRMTA